MANKIMAKAVLTLALTAATEAAWAQVDYSVVAVNEETGL